MWVFPHTDHVLRGYTHLTHEALVFRNGEAREVTEAVGASLVGAHPLQFCRLADGETEAEHRMRCRLSGASVYPTTEMEAPPIDRQMQAVRQRGRPRKPARGRA